MSEIIPWEVTKIEKKENGFLLTIKKPTRQVNGSIIDYDQKVFITKNIITQILNHIGL